ncbi:MAG TPA: CADD family putative folate metabolism protein [Candidatus Binataceae bacterium]|nr:CADD family putative folate metabolism protein [Candidatus Binataceae bacterium]
MSINNNGIIAELDRIVAGRHLLQHPFYREWTAGTLELDALREYARQYYRHVEAFPRYLSAIHSRCDDLGTRQALLENLIEEERGERNHPELWTRFAQAFGVTRDELSKSAPLPTTENLVETFYRLSRNTPIAAGLAALYAYESQMPTIADAKIDGLRRFYGVTDEDAYSFFSVHREADADHARTGGALIEKLVETSNDRDAVIAAARAAVDALWTMLDGIHRG